MGVKNLTSVMENLDMLGAAAVATFYTSMRLAGESVAQDNMANNIPANVTGRLKKSFGVWYSRRLSRRMGVGIFRVGLYTNYYYITLSKGRKTRRKDKLTKKGILKKARKGFSAPYPNWLIPGEDENARQIYLSRVKIIFDGMIKDFEQKRMAL